MSAISAGPSADDPLDRDLRDLLHRSAVEDVEKPGLGDLLPRPLGAGDSGLTACVHDRANLNDAASHRPARLQTG